MLTDAQGLALSTDSTAARDAFDRTLDEYFEYRLSTGKTLKTVLEADPEFGLAHVFQGCLFMLFGSASFFPRVERALASARPLLVDASERERLHADALEAWLAGDLLRACAHWEAILQAHPHDLLALRLHHFNTFWMGRNQSLRGTVASVLDAWDESLPGYGNVLGMYAFGLEECGEYAAAEAAGREAVERNPEDLWSIHAIAHVLEMQGRLGEGVAWLDRPADRWEDRNPFRGHLWWHLALFVFEGGDLDRALALYDRSIGVEKTEFYLDIQNMASLLYRLEFQGVDVGERWHELADHAESRIGDHVLAFTDVHCVMALAADRRGGPVRAYLDSMRAFGAREGDFAATTMAGICVPLGEAIVALREGDFDRCIERLMPIRDDLAPVGGSHAQRDVFSQVLVEAAIGARRWPLARYLLGGRVVRRPDSVWNWRKYARVLEAMGDAEGAARAVARTATA